MFYADLHVHSKFSRATSRDCDLERLALWAGRKGIAVVATGDFTHPAWFAELEAKLAPAEPGLFRLRPELERQIARSPDGPVRADVRFMLQVEISTIYKKDGRTRKVHHLIYAPELAHARRLIDRLARIGNLSSDGRPILGLDSRDLLEIALESGEGCYLVPAHVWTPWFAVLGSSSGFDSIEHCYGDLSPEVFALETGLSSDPAMNWRLSALDRYALVSNSDAHSPPKLGREACVFDTDMDYFAMRSALKTGRGYGGTVEFFPEEGKYHLDGHRKCGTCLTPEETRRYGGKCPACAKPLTLGVMHRVCELADRPAPPEPLPLRAAPFRSLIPLDEVLSEIHGVGPQSHTVRRKYDELLARLGPELDVLQYVPLEDAARLGSPLLAEALRRMRAGRVIRQAGFDGQYGTIRLFAPEELPARSSVGLLFDLPEEPPGDSIAERASAELGAGRGTSDPLETPGRRGVGEAEQPPLGVVARSEDRPPRHGDRPRRPDILEQLDPNQRAAAEAIRGPVLIVAGPGTGKTRTLTHRLAHLVADHDVPPEQCLALTFSRRAAAEMIERLQRLLPEKACRVPVMTLHALGLAMLREHGERLGLGGSLRVASQAERAQMLSDVLGLSPTKAHRALARISRAKRRSHPGEAGQPTANPAMTEAYQREMRARAWLDFDDLIVLPLRLLEENPDLADAWQARYCQVSVDEFQDLDAAQYELLRRLVPPEGNLCAIGDPDQAIYGFRGAEARCFQRFREDYPAARSIVLGRNYRSTQTIVDAALQLVGPASALGDRVLEAQALGAEQIEIHECATDRAEAEFVVHTIERLIGGSTFFSHDSRRVGAGDGECLSFADFAVLYRTQSQSEPLVEALERSGMPFQRRGHEPLADQPAVQALARAMIDEWSGGCSGTAVGALLERAAARVQPTHPEAQALVAGLRRLAASAGDDLPRFLSEIALEADADLWDPRAQRISLLTLHAAKGLEFPVVFIVGCEDGLVPLDWGAADPERRAEERRLLFVGMTRAEGRLFLTHARKRFSRGSLRPATPSPFLNDIEQQLLAWHRHRAERRAAPAARQGQLFE